ncbi:unhealthy ribosome biogenesis protein 2 homolog isoform X2 [Melanotaenia boesemani]|nr:unhealthy ribosome biogenesis protein 2 homolog isoform X2 [Melanotaenia boesemani]XP_041856794.1 unhealthy ribosome biogenesis protein 2 homolog isoform X2 [Melanotaenia boesemani]
MAAIYSGIHLKLKSPQTPWEDKLKLARFAWISSQCLLPNKEQVLLDWCTHALTGWHNKKVEFSQDILEGLWSYLDDALHSQKLHSFLKQGKTITLRLNMAQLLLDQLQECAHGQSPLCVSTILSVLRGIFSSPVLSSLFTSKYELFVNLVSKFCLLACHKIQKPLRTQHQITESDTCQGGMITESPQNGNDTTLETSKVEQITGSSPPDLPELDVNTHSKPKKSHPSANLFEVLLQVLSCYLSVQRQQANPNRVFTMVTNQLIQPLVLLRYLLASEEFASSPTRMHLRQQLCRDMRVKIDSILHLALFPSEHLALYKGELLPAKEDSGKCGSGGTKGPLKPVSAILCKLSAHDYCEPSLHYSVKSDALGLLFKIFLESYRKGKGDTEEEQRMLCFHFLVRLVPALDLHPDGCSITAAKTEQRGAVSPGQKSPPASPCTPESWSLALQAVESLLSQALSADIYNVAADRIRHKEVQLNFYRSLAQILFNEAQPSMPSWYRCLKVLLGLNHLILEPDLDQLLSSAWIDAEDMEAQVQQARQLMVSSLLQIYTKLRQLPRLFSVLLSVICQPALDDRRPPLLSDGISISLRTCFLDTPPSQILEICSSVLKSINTYILPDLVKEGEADKMEIDGGHRNQEREDASLKLSSLSQLLHVVLFNLKTLDNASPVPLVKQCKGLMEEMQQTVKALLHLLPAERTPFKLDVTSTKRIPKKGKKSLDPKETEKVSEVKMETFWEHRTQEAALLLRYTWVEVDTLFHIYCSKYTSVDSSLTAAVKQSDATSSSSLLLHMDGLHPSPSCSPMSSLLLKHLTLQQMKKILLERSLLHESSTEALLNRAAQFILGKSEFEVRPDEEQGWDGQIGSVNASTYRVAHWFFLTSNLPLILPYLSGEEVSHIAHILVSSLMNRQIESPKDQPPGWLSFSLISSQLIESPKFAEMASLFSATVHSLMLRIINVLKAGHKPKICPTFLTFHQKENGANSSEGDISQPVSTLVNKEAIVEDILASSKTGDVHFLLADTQTKELVNLIQIITNLNQDGMNSEDLSSLFLLLFFLLTSTSRQPDQMIADSPESVADGLFLTKLLRLLDYLLEGRTFHSVLKLIHGGTLLQTAVSCLLNRNSTRVGTMCSTDWQNLVKAAQSFIRSLVQLIIIRNSSIRLNLDQFASYLTSKEKTDRQIGLSTSGASLMSAQLLLASLTSFSQAIISNLGRSKPMDQTLTQMLSKTTASLGPAVESTMKPQNANETVIQPASILGQAFIVEVVTVMLHCEVAPLVVQEESKQSGTQLTLTHRTLYQGFCQQILREINSAPRPIDFLVSSLHFLSAFYTALERMRKKKLQEEAEEGGKELEELFMQILQNVYRLMAAPWLSSTDVGELEPAVQELLHHLVEKSTTSQFNLLLLMIREGLDISKLRAGNYREVLSAVIIIKLLSCCPLPEACSKALWLIVPHIISAMVLLVRSSSQDVSLTLPFTVPTVTSMVSLLRQGEGLITNPHHVILILGALHSLPLGHLTPPVYHSVFLAVHEALFAIIQCHPQVILKAAPSFLNVFYRLVASIMQEGRQRGDSDTGADSGEYLQCSRLVERMYTHIAATAESFTALSAFMVAQYVTELQKVTLRPDVKLHLTEGIYCILDLCMEQDLKFLKTGLHLGVREVFNELYSSYTHYHKTQRQGEDKYTV